MKDVPVSARFDDIYFSKEDGLAETAHVFLNGNHLPAAWENKPRFTIFETGFGTGLNFFSVWKLFEESAQKSQTLDFISVEKYPLKVDDIKAALLPWADYFDGRIEEFLKLYPIRVSGFHRIKINSQITLTLIFEDVNDSIEQVKANIDCWFLDGFTPSKNPDMWSDILFKNMARLSNEGASFASFTAAGQVRRNLEDVGFQVTKQKGFGHKREMIAGYFKAKNSLSPSKYLKQGSKVAIIGGGLAGTSCAFVLKKYGFHPIIYEQAGHLAAGASGNDIGLYNPRFSKRRDDISNFFSPAYAAFIVIARQAGEAINYNPCGALHLLNEENKAERYQSMAQNWGWDRDHIQMVDKTQASEIAGISLDYGALYLPDSGFINPSQLCSYYARGTEVHYDKALYDLKSIEADAVIIACAAAVQNFDCLKWLELENIRGQVTTISQTDLTKNLKCNLHYGSYISAPHNGHHGVGSTFEKWITHRDVLQKDHDENILHLKQNVKSFEHEDFKIQNGRAAMRAATNDRLPLIGAVPNEKNIYVSAAFGSHGIVSSLQAAYLIADIIRGGPYCLPEKTTVQLSPRRFIDRAAKRGRVLV